MSISQGQAVVTQILAKHAKCAVDDLSLDQNLNALGLDSLSLVETLFEIEEVFDIHIPLARDNEPSNHMAEKTLGQLCEQVDALVQLKKT